MEVGKKRIVFKPPSALKQLKELLNMFGYPYYLLWFVNYENSNDTFFYLLEKDEVLQMIEPFTETKLVGTIIPYGILNIPINHSCEIEIEGVDSGDILLIEKLPKHLFVEVYSVINGRFYLEDYFYENKSSIEHLLYKSKHLFYKIGRNSFLLSIGKKTFSVNF